MRRASSYITTTTFAGYSHVVIFAKKGARAKKFFYNWTEANQFLQQIEKEEERYGSEFGFLTEKERLAVMRWRLFCEDAPDHKLDLVRVIEEAATRYLEAAKTHTVGGLWEKYRAHLEAHQAADRHLQSLDSRLRKIVDAWDKLAISVPSQSLFDQLVTQLHPDDALITRRNRYASARAMFEFCVEVLEWREDNPIGLPRVVRTRSNLQKMAAKRECLEPVEIKRFLEACREVSASNLLVWVLKFFAGIRDSEVRQLVPARDIDLKKKTIHVARKLDNKTGRSRVVKISKNLDAWLRLCDFEKPIVSDTQYKRYHKKILSLLGGNFSLPDNCARHSFATYHLYAFRNAGETAIQLGHKEKLDTLWKHYENSAYQDFAYDFWGIFPD